MDICGIENKKRVHVQTVMCGLDRTVTAGEGGRDSIMGQRNIVIFTVDIIMINDWEGVFVQGGGVEKKI